MADPKEILRSLQCTWEKDRNPDSLAKGLAIGLFVDFS